MRTIFYCFFFFTVILVNQSSATHIVGGEMNYRWLGNDNYEITLTVYRDCYNGQAPFDDPASVGIYDGSGNLVDNISAYINFQQHVANVINSPCLVPPTNVCYEVAQYIFTTVLPAGVGAYTISYQRCCRNYSTINLANVQNTGATYTTQVTDQSIAAVNSNPVFNEWPPTFICKDVPFTFDHSATDQDGDSLVYELSYPYEGGDQVNRAPNPPASPPYSPVTFLPPYSVNNPFGGVALQINSITGEIKATPNSEGQYVYGIRVKEFRNGIYLGETRRDFQVNVVSCPQITVASIYSPTIACGSLDAVFVNNSYNASTYQWDFGDNSSPTDTSTEKNPTYTYPAIGDYYARLIAYSSINVLCNDTAEGLVHVYPEFLASNYVSNQHCSNEFSFFDQSSGLSGSATFWFWNFGDGTRSSLKNPIHIYNTPGEYEVMMTASADSACLDTAYQTVFVLQNPTVDFSIELDTCGYSIQTINTSANADSYRWDISDNSSVYAEDINHYFSNSGSFDISLIASTDSSCVDTMVTTISIPPLPEPAFDYFSAVCDSVVEFSNESRHSVRYLWEFGDSNTTQEEEPFHSYSFSGYVPVTLTAISPYGCEVKLQKNIFFISSKEPYFDAALDSCSGVYSFFNVTKGAAYYHWDFGDGNTSDVKSPTYKYPQEGDHLVKLTVNGESQCADSVGKVLNYESPLGEKLFIPNSFTPNGDGVNDLFSMSVFRPCDVYKLSIFNRWGQKVFEVNDASDFIWDGTFNGEKLAEDVYVYLLESNNSFRQGTLTILR